MIDPSKLQLKYNKQTKASTLNFPCLPRYFSIFFQDDHFFIRHFCALPLKVRCLTGTQGLTLFFLYKVAITLKDEKYKNLS